MPRLLLLIFLLFIACGETNSELERQKTKVAQAQTELQQQRTLLKTMHDSLDVEIRRNVALGMTEQQAKETEQVRIKAQETIVIASEKNLMAQQALLHLLTNPRP